MSNNSNVALPSQIATDEKMEFPSKDLAGRIENSRDLLNKVLGAGAVEGELLSLPYWLDNKGCADDIFDKHVKGLLDTKKKADARKALMAVVGSDSVKDTEKNPDEPKIKAAADAVSTAMEILVAAENEIDKIKAAVQPRLSEAHYGGAKAPEAKVGPKGPAVQMKQEFQKERMDRLEKEVQEAHPALLRALGSARGSLNEVLKKESVYGNKEEVEKFAAAIGDEAAAWNTVSEVSGLPHLDHARLLNAVRGIPATLKSLQAYTSAQRAHDFLDGNKVPSIPQSNIGDAINALVALEIMDTVLGKGHTLDTIGRGSKTSIGAESSGLRLLPKDLLDLVSAWHAYANSEAEFDRADKGPTGATGYQSEAYDDLRQRLRDSEKGDSRTQARKMLFDNLGSEDIDATSKKLDQIRNDKSIRTHMRRPLQWRESKQFREGMPAQAVRHAVYDAVADLYPKTYAEALDKRETEYPDPEFKNYADSRKDIRDFMVLASRIGISLADNLKSGQAAAAALEDEIVNGPKSSGNPGDAQESMRRKQLNDQYKAAKKQLGGALASLRTVHDEAKKAIVEDWKKTVEGKKLYEEMVAPHREGWQNAMEEYLGKVLALTVGGSAQDERGITVSTENRTEQDLLEALSKVGGGGPAKLAAYEDAVKDITSKILAGLPGRSRELTVHTRGGDVPLTVQIGPDLSEPAQLDSKQYETVTLMVPADKFPLLPANFHNKLDATATALERLRSGMVSYGDVPVSILDGLLNGSLTREEKKDVEAQHAAREQAEAEGLAATRKVKQQAKQNAVQKVELKKELLEKKNKDGGADTTAKNLTQYLLRTGMRAVTSLAKALASVREANESMITVLKGQHALVSQLVGEVLGYPARTMGDNPSSVADFAGSPGSDGPTLRSLFNRLAGAPKGEEGPRGNALFHWYISNDGYGGKIVSDGPSISKKAAEDMLTDALDQIMAGPAETLREALANAPAGLLRTMQEGKGVASSHHDFKRHLSGKHPMGDYSKLMDTVRELENSTNISKYILELNKKVASLAMQAARGRSAKLRLASLLPLAMREAAEAVGASALASDTGLAAGELRRIAKKMLDGLDGAPSALPGSPEGISAALEDDDYSEAVHATIRLLATLAQQPGTSAAHSEAVKLLSLLRSHKYDEDHTEATKDALAQVRSLEDTIAGKAPDGAAAGIPGASALVERYPTDELSEDPVGYARISLLEYAEALKGADAEEFAEFMESPRGQELTAVLALAEKDPGKLDELDAVDRKLQASGGLEPLTRMHGIVSAQQHALNASAGDPVAAKKHVATSHATAASIDKLLRALRPEADAPDISGEVSRASEALSHEPVLLKRYLAGVRKLQAACRQGDRSKAMLGLSAIYGALHGAFESPEVERFSLGAQALAEGVQAAQEAPVTGAHQALANALDTGTMPVADAQQLKQEAESLPDGTLDQTDLWRIGKFLESVSGMHAEGDNALDATHEDVDDAFADTHKLLEERARLLGTDLSGMTRQAADGPDEKKPKPKKKDDSGLRHMITIDLGSEGKVREERQLFYPQIPVEAFLEMWFEKAREKSNGGPVKLSFDTFQETAAAFWDETLKGSVLNTHSLKTLEGVTDPETGRRVDGDLDEASDEVKFWSTSEDLAVKRLNNIQGHLLPLVSGLIDIYKGDIEPGLAGKENELKESIKRIGEHTRDMLHADKAEVAAQVDPEKEAVTRLDGWISALTKTPEYHSFKSKDELAGMKTLADEILSKAAGYRTSLKQAKDAGAKEAVEAEAQSYLSSTFKKAGDLLGRKMPKIKGGAKGLLDESGHVASSLLNARDLALHVRGADIETGKPFRPGDEEQVKSPDIKSEGGRVDIDLHLRDKISRTLSSTPVDAVGLDKHLEKQIKDTTGVDVASKEHDPEYLKAFTDALASILQSHPTGGVGVAPTKAHEAVAAILGKDPKDVPEAHKALADAIASGHAEKVLMSSKGTPAVEKGDTVEPPKYLYFNVPVTLAALKRFLEKTPGKTRFTARGALSVALKALDTRYAKNDTAAGKLYNTVKDLQEARATLLGAQGTRNAVGQQKDLGDADAQMQDAVQQAVSEAHAAVQSASSRYGEPEDVRAAMQEDKVGTPVERGRKSPSTGEEKSGSATDKGYMVSAWRTLSSVLGSDDLSKAAGSMQFPDIKVLEWIQYHFEDLSNIDPRNLVRDDRESKGYKTALVAKWHQIVSGMDSYLDKACELLGMSIDAPDASIADLGVAASYALTVLRTTGPEGLREHVPSFEKLLATLAKGLAQKVEGWGGDAKLSALLSGADGEGAHTYQTSMDFKELYEQVLAPLRPALQGRGIVRRMDKLYGELSQKASVQRTGFDPNIVIPQVRTLYKELVKTLEDVQVHEGSEKDQRTSSLEQSSIYNDPEHAVAGQDLKAALVDPADYAKLEDLKGRLDAVMQHKNEILRDRSGAKLAASLVDMGAFVSRMGLWMGAAPVAAKSLERLDAIPGELRAALDAGKREEVLALMHEIADDKTSWEKSLAAMQRKDPDGYKAKRAKLDACLELKGKVEARTGHRIGGRLGGLFTDVADASYVGSIRELAEKARKLADTRTTTKGEDGKLLTLENDPAFLAGHMPIMASFGAHAKDDSVRSLLLEYRDELTGNTRRGLSEDDAATLDWLRKFMGDLERAYGYVRAKRAAVGQESSTDKSGLEFDSEGNPQTAGEGNRGGEGAFSSGSRRKGSDVGEALRWSVGWDPGANLKQAVKKTMEGAKADYHFESLEDHDHFTHLIDQTLGAAHVIAGLVKENGKALAQLKKVNAQRKGGPGAMASLNSYEKELANVLTLAQTLMQDAQKFQDIVSPASGTVASIKLKDFKAYVVHMVETMEELMSREQAHVSIARRRLAKAEEHKLEIQKLVAKAKEGTGVTTASGDLTSITKEELESVRKVIFATIWDEIDQVWSKVRAKFEEQFNVVHEDWKQLFQDFRKEFGPLHTNKLTSTIINLTQMLEGPNPLINMQTVAPALKFPDRTFVDVGNDVKRRLLQQRDDLFRRMYEIEMDSGLRSTLTAYAKAVAGTGTKGLKPEYVSKVLGDLKQDEAQLGKLMRPGEESLAQAAQDLEQEVSKAVTDLEGELHCTPADERKAETELRKARDPEMDVKLQELKKKFEGLREGCKGRVWEALHGKEGGSKVASSEPVVFAREVPRGFDPRKLVAWFAGVLR